VPKYSDNQLHGRSLENMIKAANGTFSWAAADRKRELIPNIGKVTFNPKIDSKNQRYF